MTFKESIPSIASLGNVAAGFTACAFAVAGSPEMAALMILVAVLLDALDGALARSLEASSDFGAELDSLADVVSFGIVPAVLVGSLLPFELQRIGWLLATPYPLCVAWRLARFNTSSTGDPESHGHFAGLPSTGAGAAVATAVLIYVRLDPAIHFGPLFLPSMLVLLSGLTVSRIPYTHASLILGRLTHSLAVLVAVAFIAGSVMWEYEYMFGALIWSYVLSGPLVTASDKIRAVRHA